MGSDSLFNPCGERSGSCNYPVLEMQSTTVNSSPSKFRFFVRINRGAKLIVHFNIGSQWNMSREVELNIVPNYPGDELTVVDCRSQENLSMHQDHTKVKFGGKKSFIALDAE